MAAVHDALHGTHPRGVTHVGAAMEFLHAAFVVHDDVIDGDDRRRGVPSVPGRFVAEARAGGVVADSSLRLYALTGGLLTGDLALAAAIRMVATAPLPREIVTRLLDLVDEALVVTAAGELADVRFALALDHPRLPDVLEMERQKTAAYTFELPMMSGAVLAGADRTTVEGLGHVGRMLGTAYQLQDDLDGTFGDPAVTGKSDLSDLREGKHTALIAHARTTAGWEVVARHWGDATVSSSEGADVRRAMVECGSRDFVEHLADDLVRQAVGEGQRLGLPQGLISWIGEVCRPFQRESA